MGVTGDRTVTINASTTLSLWSGEVGYVVRYYNNKTKSLLVFAFVCVQSDVCIEPDNMWVYAARCGASPVCGRGIAGCTRPIVYWRERLQGWTRINPGCSWIKQLGQDSTGEVRKDPIKGWDHNEKEKKLFRKREGPTQTGNLPWQVAANGCSIKNI